jgi:hypothetical protein
VLQARAGGAPGQRTTAVEQAGGGDTPFCETQEEQQGNNEGTGGVALLAPRNSNVGRPGEGSGDGLSDKQRAARERKEEQKIKRDEEQARIHHNSKTESNDKASTAQKKTRDNSDKAVIANLKKSQGGTSTSKTAKKRKDPPNKGGGRGKGVKNKKAKKGDSLKKASKVKAGATGVSATVGQDGTEEDDEVWDSTSSVGSGVGRSITDDGSVIVGDEDHEEAQPVVPEQAKNSSKARTKRPTSMSKMARRAHLKAGIQEPSDDRGCEHRGIEDMFMECQIEPKDLRYFLEPNRLLHGNLCRGCKKPANIIDRTNCNITDKVWLYACRECGFFKCFGCLMETLEDLAKEKEASGGRRVSRRNAAK